MFLETFTSRCSLPSSVRLTLGLALLAWLSAAVAAGQEPEPPATPAQADSATAPALPEQDGVPTPVEPEQSPAVSLPAETNRERRVRALPAVSSPVQNPQREFGPVAAQIAGLTNETPPPSDTATALPAQSLTRTESTTRQTLVDPLAATALGQAQSNDDMLFTGLGNMPRPLTSPYLYSDLNASSGGFRRGDLSLNASVSFGFNFLTSRGDQPGSSATQYFATISPEIDLAFGEPATGRVLTLQYFGSLVEGDSDGRQTPYDQSFALRGVFTFSKLTLGIGLQVTEFSGGDRDFGGRSVDRGLVSLALTGNYQYSEKTSFESDLTVPVRIFQFGDNSTGVSSTNFLNYAYSPVTTVGVGFAVGALTVESNATQVYEQLLTHVVHNGGPLVIDGTLGVEFRDTGHREEINPVLGLGVTWAFREGTSLALTAERRVFNSAADSGDNYVGSDVALTLSQRLGDRVQATASIGYENASYDNASGRNRAFSNREDNYVVVQGGVVAKLGRRWSASVLGTYGNNQSSGNAVRYFHTLVQVTFAY